MKTKIRLAVGSLVDFPAHALVNAIGENLVASLVPRTVSYAVAKAAGPSLQMEYDDIITKRGEHLLFGDTVSTGPYDLRGKFKTIIAVASAVAHPKDMERAMGNILFECGYLGYESLTMPAFGTGTGKLPMADFAKMFGELFMSFRESTMSAGVSLITIVFPDLERLNAFRNNSQLPVEVYLQEPEL